MVREVGGYRGEAPRRGLLPLGSPRRPALYCQTHGSRAPRRSRTRHRRARHPDAPAFPPPVPTSLQRERPGPPQIDGKGGGPEHTYCRQVTAAAVPQPPPATLAAAAPHPKLDRSTSYSLAPINTLAAAHEPTAANTDSGADAISSQKLHPIDASPCKPSPDDLLIWCA